MPPGNSRSSSRSTPRPTASPPPRSPQPPRRSRHPPVRRAGSLDRLVGDGGRLTSREQPAGGHRDQRHADKDEQEIGGGNTPKARKAAQRRAPRPNHTR